MKIAIIGTAGRNEDETRLNRDMFHQMVAQVGKIKSLSETTLVSGGAAWADHVAVVTFLLGACASLELHIPCLWDAGNRQYHDTGVRDWKTNPGGTSNYYHRKFSTAMGMGENYSLLQIDEAISDGAKASVGKGFFDRNTAVAGADALVAMTFGNEGRVADGGTRDTFEKYIKSGKTMAYHLDLNTMTVHPAC